MRKIFFIAVLMLAFVTPAQADAQVSSFFNSYANDATGTVLQYSQWETFSPLSFSTPTTNGTLYRVDATGFPATYSYNAGGFTALYAGLVKLTGKCIQEKNNTVTIKLQFVDGRYQDIAESDDRVFTFNAVFMAGNVQIMARSNVYTLLKCSILFEAVH